MRIEMMGAPHPRGAFHVWAVPFLCRWPPGVAAAFSHKTDGMVDKPMFVTIK